MKNHGLGTHNDKICAEISTGNAPNTPQLIWPIHQNQPIIWDILEKSPHHMSIVHGIAEFKKVHLSFWRELHLLSHTFSCPTMCTTYLCERSVAILEKSTYLQ